MHRNVIIRRFFAFALFFFLSAETVLAQGYRGRDFWICFPENAQVENDHILTLSLFITAEARANCAIEDLRDSSVQHYTIEGGSAKEVDIDTLIEIRSSERTERKSLHIVSDNDIMVYVESHRPGSTDSYAAIPTDLLGTRYIIAGYTTLRNGGDRSFTSQAAIVATQDNTLVTAHLSATTWNGMPKGRTIEVALNRGETFQLQGAYPMFPNDLNGTSIVASKPIAFLTGHRCAQVPPQDQYCDMLLEEEPPENDWGRDFILTKFEGKDFYVARVIAAEDSTAVSLDGRYVAVLAKDTYYECDTLYHDAEITTSKPTLVAQYATSSTADAVKIGDPFMLFVIPKDRFVPEVTTTSLTSNIFQNYLNIIVPKGSRQELRIDGMPVNSVEKAIYLAPIRERSSPDGAYDILSAELREGRHLVQCREGVAVYSYGFGTQAHDFDSYGHACGMRLEKAGE